MNKDELFPDSSAGKEFACNVGDLGSIPGLGRSPGEGKGYSLPYSGLVNPMDYTVYGVTKSRTRLSNFHTHSLLDILCLLLGAVKSARNASQRAQPA